MPKQRSATLAGCQRINERLYGRSNRRCFSTLELSVMMVRWGTVSLQGLRKENNERLRHYAVLTFSWAMAFANRLEISLDDELWKRFPGVCPYCVYAPCRCAVDKTTSRSRRLPKGKFRPKTTKDWQDLLRKIYPHSDLDAAVIHLIEEIGEIASTCLLSQANRNDKKLWSSLVEELVDTVTHLFAIAKIMGFDIGQRMRMLYKNGCPICRETPCNCDLADADPKILR